MHMKVFIFILLLRLCILQQIDNTNTTILEQNLEKKDTNMINTHFPDLIIPVWSPTVKDTNNNLKEVAKIISSWFSLTTDDIKDTLLQIDSKSQENTKKETCYIKTYSRKETQSQFISNSFDNDVTFPGTILQCFHQQNIYQDCLAVPSPPQKKNSYYVKVCNKIECNRILINYPHDLNQLFKTNRSTFIYKQTYPITGYFKSSKQIAQVIKALGLNSQICRSLGLTTEKQTEITSSRSGKITVVLLQKLFSAAVDIPIDSEPNHTTTPLELLFNNQYTLDDLYRYVKFGFWGPNNPPSFVSQANYGRYFVLTVNQTEYTLSLLQKLNKIYNNFEITMELEQVLSNLLADKSALTFSRGLYANTNQQIKKFMDLSIFFAPITNQLLQKNALQPLSFSAINFNGVKILQTQLLIYTKVQCLKPQKVILTVKNIKKEVRVKLKRKEDKDFNTFVLNFNNKEGGSYEITNLLSQQNQLRFRLKGERNWYLQSLGYRYSSEMYIQIQINDQIVEIKEAGCKRCKPEFKDYYCKINLNKQTANCQQQ